MSRYVDAEYVKAVMLNDRLMQGNAEFTLYVQQVETQVNALPGIDIVRCSECKHWRTYETWSECELWTDDPYESAKTKANDFCSYGSRSEKANNCEHITEDGVTCAKYPACDDCLDNPLNKVKGSERLVKGSEQTEPTSSKMEQVEPQTCSFSDCDNFKNPDYERCIKCKRKQIKLKTEQTERSE